MSRMLAWVAPDARSLPDAVGPGILRDFVALSRLHADGWGTAWIDPDDGLVHVDTELDTSGHRLPASWLRPTVARLVYLRFASRGARVRPENAQPFLRGGVAFGHNGLLAPREDAAALLSDSARAALRGDTDSEIYFAVARSAGLGAAVRGDAGGGAGSGAGDGATDEPSGGEADGEAAAGLDAVALARAAHSVRGRFATACLNAIALSPVALSVVHAPGSARVPLAAFAGRGFGPRDLPPGHDDDYNTLRTTVTADGARIVATTGIPQSSWETLPRDTVLAFGPGAPRSPARRRIGAAPS